jgi:hypothetical protein
VTYYINATCKVGQQSRACGRPATHAIAVVAWDETGDGGVVALCEYHATTPVSEWTTTRDADRAAQTEEASA